MRYSMSLWIALAVSGTCFSTGCSTSSLWKTSTTPTPLAGASAGIPVAAGVPPAAAAATTESPVADIYGSMPQQASATSTANGGVVLASLRQVGDSISNAFRVEPKVSPPDDPVKLDSQPKDTDKAAVDLHYAAGYFFESQKKFSEAGAHYRDALQRSPNDVRSLCGYGRVLDQLGNRAEAESHLKKACEASKTDPVPWNDLAQCYARRQELQLAIPCLQHAIKLAPTNASYRSQLARLLIESGNQQEAVQVLASTLGAGNAQKQVDFWIAQRRELEMAKSVPPPQRLPETL